MEFNEDAFAGYIIKGDLHGAMGYVKHFAATADLYHRYISVFRDAQYLTYEADAYLNAILTIYQQYYREAFYLDVAAEVAAESMRKRFSAFFRLNDDSAELDHMEDTVIADAFCSRGFQFLGGKTSGYYGPYIWKTTEPKTFDVELPGGVQTYTVSFLDGFISKSWIDYLSFGKISTGGWTNGDGIINCVRSSYNLEAESFTVSLLKHEAQHAADFWSYQDMPPEELEYRAKLVELIYSRERNLLEQFICEAGGSQKDNGHTAAANRIVMAYAKKLKRDRAELGSLPMGEMQAIAKELFAESNEEVRLKYKGRHENAAPGGR